MSVAKKVNLKFEEAEPKLTEGLIKSIGSVASVEKINEIFQES
jgi:hypothetical protein